MQIGSLKSGQPALNEKCRIIRQEVFHPFLSNGSPVYKQVKNAGQSGLKPNTSDLESYKREG